jgi:uncharacterized UBP type Zn finger protein
MTNSRASYGRRAGAMIHLSQKTGPAIPAPFDLPYPGEEFRMAQTCKHMKEIRDVTPRTPNGCEECLKMGDTWVHLRLCLECGHVGCCDSSKNKHATKHFHSTHHPIMKSFEPGEDWMWCYIDEIEID